MKKLLGLSLKLKTLWALGPVNIWRVGGYRLGLRSKLHPVLKIKADPAKGPFFVAPIGQASVSVPRTAWDTDATYFSHHSFPLNGVPNWFANPFKDGVFAPGNKPWSEISDFNPELGDIKTVWEASRFDWVLALAQRAAAGSAADLDRLNVWLEDWSTQNAPYLGVNWKCGQEASIRVLHLALAAQILGDDQAPSTGLQSIVALHLERIFPTTAYAMGQSNNHGTSEAAALFIGGSWLAAVHPKGKKWADAGRRLLEDRARVLIAADGTFSQYSTVYHRMVLDTYVMGENWRAQKNLAPFSKRLTQRLAAATRWLEAMMDAGTGDVPNLGANDGAQILKLTDGDFRDFRPSVHLASLLFRGTRAIKGAGHWDRAAGWLGIKTDLPEAVPPQSMTLDDGGFHILRNARVMALLRYPRFQFRPSQSDVLHLDLWVDGRNILRDAGTFSYNSTPDDLSYFPGTIAHNTVQFDDRDQMPRLSRFLFGSWLKARDVVSVSQQGNATDAAAGYCDTYGACHHRSVSVSANSMTVKDKIKGFQSKAILRWRLAPGQYRLEGQKLTGEGIEIEITSDAPLRSIALVPGYESRHYLSKTDIPVLEIDVSDAGQIETRVSF